LLTRKSVAASLSTLSNTCAAGAQCPEVQGSPIAQQALSVLQKAVGVAAGTLTSKQAAATALSTFSKALQSDFKAARVALVTYEVAVASIAGGSASVITKAGLIARDVSSPASLLEAVSVVRTKPGRHPMEAILSWPAAPGATGYAIEVNFTPQVAGAPWVALTSGSSRRRVVKAPTPGAQFLARVASLGSGGTDPTSENLRASAGKRLPAMSGCPS
jgi:hypothetical protein